jgi:hypothetical protein
MPRNKRASERGGHEMVEAPATTLEDVPTPAVEEENEVSETTYEEATVLDENADVDVPASDDTDIPASENATGEAGEKKAAKAKKEPARGDLPEGYVTPVGFAKALSAHLRDQGKSNSKGPIDPDTNPVPPQQIYSYQRNAPKDHPMPFETVTDSIGKERQAGKLVDLLAWWDAKGTRAEERKANAAAKAEKKTTKAENADGEAAVSQEPVAVEAE